ncbi:PucR family transcriptional regulator [Nocardioides stalactiti]|uniref:PucR family transcriptional regulator n=1 Tax=Nocardioides stalactiti TaxID=2755356 RepID=UPI0015FF1C3F|nr:helix-turn-helix domain-containing protein [Nocardioides stalactiti]
MGEEASRGALTDEERLVLLLERLADTATVLEVAGHLNELLIAEVPELGADPAIRSDLDAATAALAGALASTPAGEPLLGVVIPELVLDLVRAMARRRIDITVVLRGIRVGHRLSWQEVIRVLDAEVDDPELRYAALTLGWDRIAAAIEAVAEAAVAAYTAERDEWLRGAHARKAEVVAALLDGEPVDVDEATATLGYRLRRRHLAFMLWLDGPSSAPASALASAATAIRAELGAPDHLSHPEGARSLTIWLGFDTEPDPAALRRTALPPGVRTAYGLPALGVGGFVRSRSQALAARRVAEHAPGHPATTSYDDVELVSAFLDQPEVTSELVRRELGDLVAEGPVAARLRETAHGYLRAGGNARDAATLIGTHKNTVLYRLPQIEAALGHGVLDRRLKLEVALTMVEHLGEPVLQAARDLGRPHKGASSVGSRNLV